MFKFVKYVNLKLILKTMKRQIIQPKNNGKVLNKTKKQLRNDAFNLEILEQIKNEMSNNEKQIFIDFSVSKINIMTYITYSIIALYYKKTLIFKDGNN